jgi:hypothetical protein
LSNVTKLFKLDNKNQTKRNNRKSRAFEVVKKNHHKNPQVSFEVSKCYILLIMKKGMKKGKKGKKGRGFFFFFFES